jgi:hypothetical protein
MPAPPALRRKAIEAIGDVLSKEAIKRLVWEATGNDIYNIYASEADSKATCVFKTLDRLEDEGTEKWLLTTILAAVTQERLRALIVTVWPDTLVSLPPAEAQVAGALKNLDALLRVPLPTNLKYGLKNKYRAFGDILQRIAALIAYKNLQEYLHQLKLKLTFAELMLPAGTAVRDFSDIVVVCDVTKAPAFAPLLGAHSDRTKTELDWISQLRALTASLASAAAASDGAACSRAADAIRHLIGFHLLRLNKQLLKAATELSFEELINDLPLDLELQDAFNDLVHAVRELKSTVLARALKHTLWQLAENDISLVEDFFAVPGQEVADISELWFSVKSRVAWLADLDPDDGWGRQARELSDEIDDGLAKSRRLDGQITARFEAYRNLFRFRFLAIDNTLKLDCNSLRAIDAPLTEIRKELAP